MEENVGRGVEGGGEGEGGDGEYGRVGCREDKGWVSRNVAMVRGDRWWEAER